MKINREKLKTYAAATLLVGTALTFTGYVYDGMLNHDSEYCPFNMIFGLEHQAKKINEGTNSFRYEAVYIPESEGAIPEGCEEYNGYYGQHVIEYVSYAKLQDSNIVIGDGINAVHDGFLEPNAIPSGERVEIYDNNGVSEDPQLIRIIK